jgi:hypothetical protein
MPETDLHRPMLTVTDAHEADVPVLAALWADRLALLTQLDPRIVFPADGEARWAAHLHALLGRERACVPVARLDGAIVGYAIGQVRDDALLRPVGWVEYMALDLHRPAHGAARALVAALQARFRAAGVVRAAVHVAGASAVEAAFWRALGTRVVKDMVWMRC